jgi:hypothetical protein
MVDNPPSRFEVSPTGEVSASNHSKDETVQQRWKVWEMERVNKLAFLLGAGPAGCWLQSRADGGDK